MISKERIMEIVENYDLNDLSIAAVCSHSSLQIFDGARKEGFKTIGICVNEPPRFYDAFPLAKPDEFLVIESHKDISSIIDTLVAKNAILIPHGSVRYIGSDVFSDLAVPIFGNRSVLDWESDTDKERVWLKGAGLEMPGIILPEDINGPVMVKYKDSISGCGFFVAKNYEEFRENADMNKEFTIKEFILGTRYNLHFFYSPLRNEGYKLSNGILEMLSMDRMVESNADEIFRLGSPRELAEADVIPTYVVTGNIPLVARESLLPKIFSIGENVVEESLKLFGGMIGPFCLETVFTDKLEIKVIDISSGIVGGTNLYLSGSPYSDLLESDLSTGKRIAQELNLAKATGQLSRILS
ncbi:MAG: formate--phosphoribosylaminoimidazolecarboxamide ligase [Methanolobus sp.]|nr:formate--phosphoribosylaminoimidazolecarboxamide ligase [Methanolobus sp.]